jgi:hypothetical protein
MDHKHPRHKKYFKKESHLDEPIVKPQPSRPNLK